MRVSVDARPLDRDRVRVQGIGRYARGLLDALPAVAAERGGELVVLRERAGRRAPVHHALSPYEAPLLRQSGLVVTMHDVAPLLWPSDYLRTGLRHRLLYRAAARAEAIICPSRAAHDDVVARLGVAPERVHVVPEGVGAEFGAEPDVRAAVDPPYLLYVGSIDDPRKDVPGLVRAFGEWAPAHDRRESLVLAGPGSIALPQPGPDAPRVVCTGYVPDAELRALYAGAVCLVSASRHEGFGLPALEALACGTPVVAYRTGALPEVAGPGALLVGVGDGAALMEAAGRLADDPPLRERLAAAGREHAGRFTWRRAAEETWDVYEQVAA